MPPRRRHIFRHVRCFHSATVCYFFICSLRYFAISLLSERHVHLRHMPMLTARYAAEAVCATAAFHITGLLYYAAAMPSESKMIR